ncbi:retrovirus-related pol polyprotein from transposon TNT 1-94 [Tanacetum coccineum]|uniref:Retrovirus-related pol polyprotein from transposon TNT 1-94 n=1 Tax=Tanacetum coccineum TaxID=301880 RepID=A0ABQ4ZUE8_9ASTR
MEESTPWTKKNRSSQIFQTLKQDINTIFNGVECCKEVMHKKTWHGYIDPVISSTIETNFDPSVHKLMTNTERFVQSLKEEMVIDLKYFNSLENEIESLQSQLETQRTQFFNEIDRLSKEYYYADHMNAILGVYTKLDEVTNLQCDYLEALEKCQSLENELSKRNTTSKSFEALQQHAINLELALQQCQEQIKNDKAWKQKESTSFRELNVKYFEIQDLKAQLQDKGIAISELKKLIEKMKGKYVETKFEKPSIIRQPKAFKSQRQSILGVIPTTSVSRPQIKSNQLEDKVMHNNSQWKKQQVEDHRRNFKTKQLIVVPISTREPKRILVEIILFIVDSRCSKHMTRNLKLLSNFVEKFMGTTKFGNDQIAPILGYGDLVQGNATIKGVYYVEGLNYNLFSVGQLCDADLEVAFRKSACYIRDLKGNDLLTGSRGTDLYSITLQNTTSPNLICLMAKASLPQAWLWHRHLSHPNFDTINLLSKYDIVTGLPKLKFFKDHICSSCELWKAKHNSFKTKTTPSSKRRLQILHMDLCGPMRVESFKGKKYVMVIVDDYSRYTWTYFLRSKDETPKILIDFLKLVQRGLHAQVRTIQTDKGTEFLNKTLHACFAQEGIEHQMSTARTPEQNNVVKRQHRTLVEAARTMLSAAKVPLFFWSEAIATTYFTKNHGENLDKMKDKGDACIFVVYSTQSRAYRVYNKRTRVIVETIHVNIDELPLMASVETVTTSNELDLLFSLMFNELLNGTTPVVRKSSAVHAVDAPDQRQQQNTTTSTSTTVAADTLPLNIQTTPETISQTPTQATTVTATENINQEETHKENAQVNEDKFINIFKQVIGNPSQSIRTRRQLETDDEMCMFALTMSQTEPKNIKEAMVNSAWIEAMQEELH